MIIRQVWRRWFQPKVSFSSASWTRHTRCGHDGLNREAYGKFSAAQVKTAWRRHHQRRFALVDVADVLAGATQYDLAAVLDRRPVRVCGIGSIFSGPAHRSAGHAQELVDRLLDEAACDGAAIALSFQTQATNSQPAST